MWTLILYIIYIIYYNIQYIRWEKNTGTPKYLENYKFFRKLFHIKIIKFKKSIYWSYEFDLGSITKKWIGYEIFYILCQNVNFVNSYIKDYLKEILL